MPICDMILLLYSLRRRLFNVAGKRSDDNVLVDWEKSKQGYCGRTTML